MFEIVAPEKSYFLSADTDRERLEWVQALEQAKFVHSMKMDREEKARKNSEAPTIVGIGVILRNDRGEYIIEQIIENGPADLSQKLRTRDRVLEVDGTSTADLQFNQVLDLIRGQVGTFVELLIRRGSGEEEELLTIELRRDVVKRVDVMPLASPTLNLAAVRHRREDPPGERRASHYAVAPAEGANGSTPGPVGKALRRWDV